MPYRTNSGRPTSTPSGKASKPAVQSAETGQIGGGDFLTRLAGQLGQVSAGTTNAADGAQPGEQKGITTNYDWRARLRPKDGGKDLFWKGIGGSRNEAPVDYLLKPLHDTNGLIWQYTPDILVSSQVNYNMPDFHGQNYPLMTYKNTIPPAIPVTSDFSANTIDEARYMLGIQHFCKVATKSFFGDAAVESGYYGTPPPVLLFEYLGKHGFNKVPVVITSYSITYGADVDYIPVKTDVLGGEVTYVPTMFNMQINLQPSYAPHKLRKNFDLQNFTTGVNYKDGYI